MGSHPYYYFTPYQPDIATTLDTLRQQEFEAGRYNPVMPFPFDPELNEEVKTLYPSSDSYPSIEAALEAADADGTRSILDIAQVSEEPALCATCSVSPDLLLSMFGTDKPARKMIEAVILQEQALPDADEDFDIYEDFIDTIGRGECRHIICYEDDEPVEVFFMGYSFD
ncbi:MAG: hypothetical protein SFY66_09510 [Oculatellaceae cyanobacterium bins.114]|nr:hypothetical protein [Oculatellaceae cyanobacterium bins.114]